MMWFFLAIFANKWIRCFSQLFTVCSHTVIFKGRSLGQNRRTLSAQNGAATHGLSHTLPETTTYSWYLYYNGNNPIPTGHTSPHTRTAFLLHFPIAAVRCTPSSLASPTASAYDAHSIPIQFPRAHYHRCPSQLTKAASATSAHHPPLFHSHHPQTAATAVVRRPSQNSFAASDCPQPSPQAPTVTPSYHGL